MLNAGLLHALAFLQPLKMSSVLITGGTGYTGQFLVQHFAASGYEVGVSPSVAWGIMPEIQGRLCAHWELPEASARLCKSPPCNTQVGYTYNSSAAQDQAGDVRAFKVRVQRQHRRAAA